VSDDAEVLAAIARAHDLLDPVPEFVREAARAAFAWRDPAAILAELRTDDARSEAGLRGVGGPRRLLFAAGDQTVDLEVHEHGTRRRVLGQLIPTAPGLLRALVGDLEGDVPLDVLGRFMLDDLPSGPFRLRWTPESGPMLVTSWVIL
jgi:hypothetical protein